MRRLVLIEFVQTTAKRSRGERIMVDPVSASSLCDRKKVAVRVGPSQPPPPRTVLAPPAPAPLVVPTAPEVEGDDYVDDDDTDAA